MDGPDHLASLRIVRPDFQSNRPLPGGRQKTRQRFGVQRSALDRETAVRRQAEALKAGRRENHRGKFPANHLGQTRGNIPAHGLDPDVAAQGQKHGRAARTSRSHPRTRGKRGRAAWMSADQHIGRIAPRQDRAQSEARWQHHGQVLETVHRGVRAAAHQFPFELHSENA